MPNERREVRIENAHIFKTNFSGREGLYNPPGSKNFLVSLDEDVATALKAEGWNVKWPGERPEDEDEDAPVYSPYIAVQLGYKFASLAPRIVMITSTNKIFLNEKTVPVLDQVDIAKVDLVFRARYWGSSAPGEKGGIKAYLKRLFVTIDEDPFDIKYGINDMLQSEEAQESILVGEDA